MPSFPHSTPNTVDTTFLLYEHEMTTHPFQCQVWHQPLSSVTQAVAILHHVDFLLPSWTHSSSVVYFTVGREIHDNCNSDHFSALILSSHITEWGPKSWYWSVGRHYLCPPNPWLLISCLTPLCFYWAFCCFWNILGWLFPLLFVDTPCVLIGSHKSCSVQGLMKSLFWWPFILE